MRRSRRSEPSKWLKPPLPDPWLKRIESLRTLVVPRRASPILVTKRSISSSGVVERKGACPFGVNPRLSSEVAPRNPREQDGAALKTKAARERRNGRKGDQPLQGIVLQERLVKPPARPGS